MMYSEDEIPEDKKYLLEEYMQFIESNLDRYQTNFNATYEKNIQDYIQHGVQIDTSQLQNLASKQSSSSGIPSSTESAFKTRNDLLPTPLAKGISPLETSEWVEKFDYWFSVAYGGAGDVSIKAAELKYKLDSK